MCLSQTSSKKEATTSTLVWQKWEELKDLGTEMLLALLRELLSSLERLHRRCLGRRQRTGRTNAARAAIPGRGVQKCGDAQRIACRGNAPVSAMEVFSAMESIVGSAARLRREAFRSSSSSLAFSIRIWMLCQV